MIPDSNYFQLVMIKTLLLRAMASLNRYLVFAGLAVAVTMLVAGCGNSAAGPDATLSNQKTRPGAGVSFANAKWTRHQAEPALDLVSIAWSGKEYVAVDRSGVIVRSEDLQRWTQIKTSPQICLTTVAWLGSEFLAGGHEAAMIIPSSVASKVKPGGNLPQVGRVGPILTSPDGRVWSPAQVDSQGIVSRFVRSGSLLFAVCEGGDILARTDGGAWKVVTNLKPATGRDVISPCAVAWSGKQFAAAGLVKQFIGDRSFSLIEFGGVILTSPDGVRWAAQRCAKPVLDVIWTGKTFAAIQNDGHLLLSEDGAKWSTDLLPVDSGSSIAWTGSEFAIGADDGVVITGQKGAWKEHRPGFQGAATCLIWTGTKLLVPVGDSVFVGTP